MIRRTSDLEGREVTSSIANDIAFSPNGRWLAYIDANQIKKVSAEGGASIPIATLTSVSVRGLAWLSQDTILVGSLAGLFSVPAAGGTLRPVAGFPADSGCFTPVLLPDGKSVACSTGLGTSPRRIRVNSIESGKATVLDLLASAPLGMQDGHLVYVTALGALMAVPFDLARQRMTGDPSEIEPGILMSPNNSVPLASLSPHGTLAYLLGASTQRVVLSAAGRPDVPLIDEPRTYRYPRFSPDARKVAVTVNGPDGPDIWVFDRVGQTYTRLTFTGGNQLPEWSPEGTKILYRATAPREIWWQAADGSTQPELLYTADEAVNEALLSPDGKWLVYRTSPFAEHVRDIFAVPLEGDRKPVLLAGGPFQESHPRISPDGHWMVYQSNENGPFEIYVRPFPGAGSRTQVSSNGGSEPVWSRSGRELYYRTPAGLVVASVTTGAKFTIGDRRTVSLGESYDDATHAGYDVGPNGELLMLRPTGSTVTGVLVHNWRRVLREKLGLVKK
jgi:serine/threonine-protein kinase